MGLWEVTSSSVPEVVQSRVSQVQMSAVSSPQVPRSEHLGLGKPKSQALTQGQLHLQPPAFCSLPALGLSSHIKEVTQPCRLHFSQHSPLLLPNISTVVLMLTVSGVFYENTLQLGLSVSCFDLCSYATFH